MAFFTVPPILSIRLLLADDLNIYRDLNCDHSSTPNIKILVYFFMHMFDLADKFLQATPRCDSIVVGTFGNNDNIVISNIVIFRTFRIATRCKYPETLISEICILYGILLVTFINFGKIYMYSNWIRTDTEYLSEFSPNAGKYGHFGHFSRSKTVAIFTATIRIRWRI